MKREIDFVVIASSYLDIECVASVSSACENFLLVVTKLKTIASFCRDALEGVLVLDISGVGGREAPSIIISRFLEAEVGFNYYFSKNLKTILCDFCYAEVEYLFFREFRSKYRSECFFNPPINTRLGYPISFEPKLIMRSILKFLRSGVVELPRKAGEKIYWQIASVWLYDLPAFIYSPVDWRKLFPDVISSDVLWLTGGVVEERFVAEEDYMACVDDVVGYLLGRNLSVAIKRHPRYQLLLGYEQKLPEIKSSVPVVAIAPSVKCIIAYNSSALFEVRARDCIPISLMYMMKPMDVKRREALVGYLRCNSNREIFFPSSIHEFMQVIEENNI